MKYLCSYIFYFLWLEGITFANYVKSKEFVGPIMTEFDKMCRVMHEHEQRRKAKMQKLDSNIASLKVRIEALQVRMRQQ
jgi:hypothetical protein